MPVCRDCLDSPVPAEPETMCLRCRGSFLNANALNSQGLCPVCEVEPDGFDTAYSFGSYDGVLRRLVHVYKYEHVESLAGPLGELLLTALPRDERFDVVVPMPLHWRKRWDRGFNQAELLGRFLSHKTGIPMLDVLKRNRSTAAQAGLTFAQRLINVRGAFEIRKRSWWFGAVRPVRGLHVVLVDDVLTTGATAAAGARLLKRAGARRVSVLTLARADRKYNWRTSSKATAAKA